MSTVTANGASCIPGDYRPAPIALRVRALYRGRCTRCGDWWRPGDDVAKTNAEPGRAHDVAVLLWRLCIKHRRSLAVLGWTLGGQPRHPLYVPGSTSPECLTARPISRRCPVWGYSDDPHWAQLLGYAA